MQEELITIKKPIFNKIITFLKHPITGLVFAVLVSYIFYLLSQSHKSPSFYLTPPTLVAEKTDNNLKILYNNVEYKNIYYRHLILWNDGDEYIDSDDFIASKPLNLYSDDSIKILAVNAIKASRIDLKFKSQIIDNKSINFKILDNEALEEGDGISFHILYTDFLTGNSQFKLNSRVKGTEEGFVYKNLEIYSTNKKKKSIYILWSVLILLLSIRVVILYAFKKEIVFRKWEVKFLAILFLLTVYETTKYVFYSTDLTWLN